MIPLLSAAKGAAPLPPTEASRQSSSPRPQEDAPFKPGGAQRVIRTRAREARTRSGSGAPGLRPSGRCAGAPPFPHAQAGDDRGTEMPAPAHAGRAIGHLARERPP